MSIENQQHPASPEPVAWRAFYGDKVAYSDGPEKPVSSSMDWEPVYLRPAATGLTEAEVKALELATIVANAENNVPVLAGGAEGCHFMNRQEAASALLVLAACVRRLSAPTAPDAVLDFVREIVEEGCAYGDGCPPNAGTRHGDCMPCKARAARAALAALATRGASPAVGKLTDEIWMEWPPQTEQAWNDLEDEAEYFLEMEDGTITTGIYDPGESGGRESPGYGPDMCAHQTGGKVVRYATHDAVRAALRRLLSIPSNGGRL